MKQINWAEKNGNWAGYNAKIYLSSLHSWVIRRLQKPDVCPDCGVKPSYTYDLANITGIYNRDLKNWQYLCRRCHMKLDGRLDKRLEHNKTWRQPRDPITGQFIPINISQKPRR